MPASPGRACIAIKHPLRHPGWSLARIELWIT
jgi:hypothetical protein